MSATINTQISGKFIIEDIHGNVLSEEPNAISDWGMIRLTNYNKQYSKNYIRTLADNLKRVFPGTSDFPVGGTMGLTNNYALKQPVKAQDYNHFNENTVTGTKYSRNPSNNNLIIQFTKGSRLEFKQTTGSISIKELGIGFNYDDNNDHSYRANYVDSNTANVWQAREGLSVPPTGASDQVPPYYPHSDNIDFSLWSRTTFNGVTSPIVTLENGDILIVKYVLTIETNCDQTQENWTFAADPTIGAVPLPARKTAIRRKPFFDLLPGTSPTKVGNTITSYGSVPTEYGGLNGQAGGSTVSNNPNGFLAIIPSLEQPYMGRNEIVFYDNYDSNLYTGFPNFNSDYNTYTKAPSAYSATLSATYLGTNPTYSVTTQPFITSKARQTFRTSQSADLNTYVCQHRFLFNPGEWPSYSFSGTPNARNFSFVRYNADYTDPAIAGAYLLVTAPLKLFPRPEDRTNSGIFTALSGSAAYGSQYDPYVNDNSLYVGLDYTFTFVRA